MTLENLMKRYGTSITALALAGAITLSIAPTASAQSSVELGGSSVNAAIDEVTKPVADPIIGYLSSTASCLLYTSPSPRDS